jgi:hypothetical protein
LSLPDVAFISFSLSDQSLPAIEWASLVPDTTLGAEDAL